MLLKWKLSYFHLLLGTRHVCRKCGENTLRVIRFKVDNGRQFMSQPKSGTYCSKCIESMCIKCAWCEGSIMPGDPITLYGPINRKEFQVPEYAVVYRQEPLRLVGCLRWNCADTGADRAGFWIPPGKVDRVLSPIEEVMTRMQGGEEEPVVITGNISDPRQATHIE